MYFIKRFMGAWGIGNFENDDALDWLGDYLEAPNKETIRTTLTNTVSASEIDAPQAADALAAAEIVAAMSGRPTASVPKSLEAHLQGRKWEEPTKEVIDLAVRAIERIKTESEAKALWEEAEEIDAWNGVLDNLIDRLRGPNQ